MGEGEFAENGERIGADGLTNSQWVDASKPNTMQGLAASYIDNNAAFTLARKRFFDNITNEADEWIATGGEELGRELVNNQIHIYYGGTLFSASQTRKLDWFNRASGLLTPIEDPITSGEVIALKGSFLMLAVIKGKGSSGLFIIGDGVRRAKAAQILGKKSIYAENGTSGELLNIPISKLLSPKKQLDLTHPNELKRFNDILEATRTGNIKMPIYIHPSSNSFGTLISKVKLIFK